MPPPPQKKLTLEAPRWPGGPPICEVENRPCYISEAALHSHYSRQFVGFGFKKIWKCEFCGWWHAVGDPPPPSGGTSGKKRSKNKQGL